MPVELGWRPASEMDGGFATVDEQNALPVQVIGSVSAEDGYLYQSIPTQTTTLVRTGGGRLRRIIIPTQVASATVKVWDSLAANGPVIMDTLTMPATLLTEGPMVIELGVAFTTGLTVVTGGATMPLTVVYR